MLSVESEQSFDPIGLHGRDKPSVIRSDARDAKPSDQIMPASKQLFSIEQKRKSPLEESQPLAGLLGCHAESILTTRR